eukprot:TRINITY_DN2301_c0_g1_i1.p1 TRINITY_DN2301_c0_g1~~TRINITY_DN2301_c0_g1_i1.p1  ORF type:complete len:148 (-),score=6.44 TRINITY_DN2301_c0_g1_i1:160-603(-)
MYEDAETNYLVMELWEDGSIQQALNTHPFSIPQIMDMCYQLSCGLYHLHCSGVIHADIASRNCLIDLKRMKVCLTDFGLSCKHPASKKLDSLPFRWASPELVKTRLSTLKSDIWALGITFVEILTHEEPYRSVSCREVVKGLQKDSF